MMFVTFLGIFVVVALLIHLANKKLESIRYKIQSEINATDKDYQIKKRKEEGAFTFNRINCVEGLIKVNGRTYRTFNSGTLTVGSGFDNVSIELWVTLSGCFLGEADINGMSLRAGMPNGLSAEEEAEYFKKVINGAWNTGLISASTAQSAKSILKDFQEFAYLLEEGTIAELPGTADYVWMGETRD